MIVKAEYLWLDGKQPAEIRSKTKILSVPEGTPLEELEVPVWGFDGSSTEQATGDSSDRVLQPVRIYADPIRGTPHVLVLNDVYLPSGEADPTNTRVKLEETAERHAAEEFWFGIEQEYTMFSNGRPLGFPETGFPEPQGKYYCGVGAERIAGRKLVEQHLDDCLAAGIVIAGINAEVMPGQWEYQVGPAGPLEAADDMTVARWLLERRGEEYDIAISWDPKPVKGDWNGAGAHTNFSTKSMRESLDERTIMSIMAKFRDNHASHIAVYGLRNEERLTGLHETCSIKDFRYGVSDRGASVRVPWQVALEGKGYLEDRRPAANFDPYLGLDRLIRTVCE